MQWQKNNIFSIIFMDSLGKCWKLLGFQVDDSWNFQELLQGVRGECRNLIGTQADWIYEDLLWNSPKNFTPKTTLQSEFETSLDLEKNYPLFRFVYDNRNVPWLGHEILHQILPPCGGAPICPLRKGNTSPEIRLPHQLAALAASKGTHSALKLLQSKQVPQEFVVLSMPYRRSVGVRVFSQHFIFWLT